MIGIAFSYINYLTPRLLKKSSKSLENIIDTMCRSHAQQHPSSYKIVIVSILSQVNKLATILTCLLKLDRSSTSHDNVNHSSSMSVLHLDTRYTSTTRNVNQESDVKSRDDLPVSTARQAVHSNDSEEEGSKPEDHGQEGEGLSCTPLPAVVVATKGKACPVPCRSAVDTVEPANEQTEDGGPASSED